MSRHPKIIITGGGTGGHVFPALAIAQELLRRGFVVIYVGSPTGFEARTIPAAGIPFIPISSGAVKNQSPLRIIKTAIKVMGAVVKCLRILRREKPQAVIGVGGYVSVPTSVAAYLLRIPLFLQEQNTSVGIANRFLGKLSRKIFLGFQQAHRFFPAEKCLLTGNPIRQEFFSPQFPRYRPEPSHLLVMGGSQGAHAINDAMIECLPKLKENYPQLHIQHQTGVKDCPRVQKAYAQSFPIKSEVATFDVTPFIDDVVRAYGKANLVVARSGALTISELIQVKRPAIFVPYPRKGQNDQLTNAYFMETEGVARVVEQGEDFNSRFWLTLKEILDADVLFRMANHFSKFQSTSALTLIGDEIQSSIGL